VSLPNLPSAIGLPDFSWYMIPKPEKMCYINKHKMYQMVIKYPKFP
jgi:hypothetical protein